MDRDLYPDDLAGRLKARAGAKYRPSNGSEGECFMARWCEHCTRDDDEDNPCEILTATLFLGTEDEGYPAEWHYSDRGQPICSAFSER